MASLAGKRVTRVDYVEVDLEPHYVLTFENGLHLFAQDDEYEAEAFSFMEDKFWEEAVNGKNVPSTGQKTGG